MIQNLKIKNYALLSDVNVNFSNGFTVISGETGAGKSIMIDALSLLLGKRVERFSMQKRLEKSIIEGQFSIQKSNISFFKENNIVFKNLTSIRREINTNGKSYAFINDKPVLLNTLSEFGSQIIEINAQHQSIYLKDEVAQFSLIDKLSRSKEILISYQKELQKYNQLSSELISIKNSGSLSDSELDYLKFQLAELDDSNINIGEKNKIEQKILLLENADTISKNILESDDRLNKEDGVLFQLSRIRKKLLEFKIFDNLEARIDSVIIELNDISSDLSVIGSNTKSNPSELDSLNYRLNIINKLLLKHRKKTEEDLIIYRQSVNDKINISESFAEEVKKKEKIIQHQLSVLQDAAEKLNIHRKKILPTLKKEIKKYLINLGMPHAQFDIKLDYIDSFNKFGNTSISFLFTANKGNPLLELSKVASGGELSRLMLSLQYISAKYLEIDVLIFDEIDIGVSGKIASLMGVMMNEISKSTQLIAISHLPQIASKANQHLKVVKSVISNKTISDVISLNNDERIKEIAKLLSGNELTSAAFENAKSLLSQ